MNMTYDEMVAHARRVIRANSIKNAREALARIERYAAETGGSRRLAIEWHKVRARLDSYMEREHVDG